MNALTTFEERHNMADNASCTETVLGNDSSPADEAGEVEGRATVKVASVQASSIFGDVTANINKFSDLCREAAAAGAKIIVLPETSLSGYLSQDLETNWCLPDRENRYPRGAHPSTVAQAADGPIVQHFCSLARELQCYITVPFLEVEKSEEDEEEEEKEEHGDKTTLQERFYNSVTLAGPNGNVCAHYRKNFPWPHPERSWATAGTDVAVFDTEYGRVGLAICFDIHSILVKYARHKIWALLYPIAWVGNPESWFLADFPSRLRQVSCPHFVVGCNWSTDEPQKWPGAGFSTHYAPYGELISATAHSTGSQIVYSMLATETSGRLPPPGRPGLDLDKYAAWTSMQMMRESPSRSASIPKKE